MSKKIKTAGATKRVSAISSSSSKKTPSCTTSVKKDTQKHSILSIKFMIQVKIGIIYYKSLKSNVLNRVKTILNPRKLIVLRCLVRRIEEGR